MKPNELEYGEMMTLALRLGRGASFVAPPRKGDEVRIRLPGLDDVVLAMNGRAVDVEAADDTSERRLRMLRDLDPPRISWIGHHAVHDGAEVVTVLVHQFRRRYRWDGELVLSVDERIVDRVARLAGATLDVAAVCAWLNERIVLPLDGDLPRVFATGAPDQRGRFRLLGRGVAVDVAPDQAALRVERVVQLRQGRQGFRPPEFLIEVALRFEDATNAGTVRTSVRAELERIVAESGSYLALWQRYQEIERGQLARRASELGWVKYTSREQRTSGLWAFRIEPGAPLAGLDRQSNDDVQLEAGRDLPPELLEGGRADSSDRNDRPFIGSVESIRRDQSVLMLRPFDEDSDIVPPPDGYLFAALQGDRKQLERRDDAVRRLLSANARIPQLALILEDQPARMRRTDDVAALTPSARRLFRSEPTTKQREAIDKALNTPDIALIQGPPGTGKTTVIAAIQARLAELEAEEEEVGGRTLLTSYQHDAVDNAVARSSVLGLPPARFGGRRGSRAVDEQAQRWSFEVRERLQAKLASLGEDRPQAQYRQFRDRAAAYASGKLRPADARAIVDDLLGLPVGTLPTELWDQLRALGRRMAGRSVAPRGVERALDEKAVRGLPPQNIAFEDGGPARARRALRQLDRLLADDEKALLGRAAETTPGEPFPEIDALASLRESLLDRLDPEAIPGERSGRDSDVMDALNGAVAALHERMATSPAGVADALEEYADAIHQAPGDVIRTLRHYSAVYAASCQQSVGHAIADARSASSDLWFENVVVDEAARANPLDLFIPMSLGKRRIILVGDHRQLPHMLEPDVERELSDSVSEETKRKLKQSLFERLFEDLQARELRDGVRRVVTLDKQFRMHPMLGAFVSDVFYAPFGEGFASPRPAADFAHDLPDWTTGGSPACAGWKRLSHAEGREERVGTSWARRVEADWIARECRRLIEGAGQALTIGVISFYKPQVQFILQEMLTQGLAERDADTSELRVAEQHRTLELDGRHVERLRVGTVDSFQGMEFDVVLLSVVRCNKERGKDTESLRRKYGHLLLPNRLCVAMSRQKRLLVAVGDPEMFTCTEAAEAVPGLHRFFDSCGGPHGLVA